MQARRVTPEQQEQRAQVVRKVIADYRARLVLAESQAPPGLLERLDRRVCKALLAWLERRVQPERPAQPEP